MREIHVGQQQLPATTAQPILDRLRSEPESQRLVPMHKEVLRRDERRKPLVGEATSWHPKTFRVACPASEVLSRICGRARRAYSSGDGHLRGLEPPELAMIMVAGG